MENQINTINTINTNTERPNLVMLAMSQGLDVDKLEKLIEFQERSDKRMALDAFNSAMSECQSKIRRIATDKKNNQTNSEYATYAAIDRAIRPIYSECGFSLSFDTRFINETTLEAICIVSHHAGHSQEYRVPVPCDGMGAKGNAIMTRTHAIGSAVSYGQRYLVKMIFNLAFGNDPDDDDGNGAAYEVFSQIANCHTLDELKQTYESLYRQATSTRDTKLLVAITKAKDSRKAELEAK